MKKKIYLKKVKSPYCEGCYFNVNWVSCSRSKYPTTCFSSDGKYYSCTQPKSIIFKQLTEEEVKRVKTHYVKLTEGVCDDCYLKPLRCTRTNSIERTKNCLVFSNYRCIREERKQSKKVFRKATKEEVEIYERNKTNN
jgi:hypothetical protein